MSYTPQEGSHVILTLQSDYTPFVGDNVVLDLASHTPIIFEATIEATLDNVTGDFQASFTPQTFVADLQAILDDVTGVVEAAWESGVWRGIASSHQGIHAAWIHPLQKSYREAFNQGINKRPIVACAFLKAAILSNARRFNWKVTEKKAMHRQIVWEPAGNLHQSRDSAYNAPAHKQHSAIPAWQIAAPLETTSISFYRAPPRKLLEAAFIYGEGSSQCLSRLFYYGLGDHHYRQLTIPWEVATPHSWIWGGWLQPPIPPGPPYIPSLKLVFYQHQLDYKGGAILEFGYPCFAWPLKTRTTTFFKGAIIVLHSIHVIRLPDLVEIPVLSAALKFDIDSWAWGVSLSLQTPQTMSLLEPVNGEPRQVRIEVDGVYITALIEEWGETRQFGQTLYSASGRSTLALLAGPFAPVSSYLESNQRTAAQLIDHELLNTGWSAVYHADLLQLFTTDWLIPGGAWSYQNKAPIDAVVQIARAAGARAYADRNASLLHIDPRYPVSPWDWAAATPNKTISASLVRSVATQLMPQPDYNHVYVSGQTQGVLVSAKRQGTAGDKTAPMITDNLITYVNAGRERARNILSNTGRQARVTLDLPMNEMTGLLEPGQLVEVSDSTAWRGLVTGINVSAEHGVINQTVEIERHYS